MEKLKIALWGLGRAGWGMHKKELANFTDMWEIAGCYDEIPERMEKMVQEMPSCRSYNSAAEMIADPWIDVIAVCIRSKEHVEAAVQALEGGKYVFIEKPIGINYEQVKILKAASEAHPGKLFCRQNRRFEAAFQHVTEIIKSGILGDVYMIKLSRHNYARRCDWQTMRSFGGGQLSNWGPHLIDHALQFINAPVKEIWADLRRIAASGDAEDHVKAILRGENGMVVDIEISSGAALPCPVYAVFGTQGALIAQTEKEFKLRYLDMEKTEPAPEVNTDTPAQDSGFGVKKGLVWIEKEIPCAPASGATLNDIYKHLYLAIRENIPFPVKNEEAFEVARITDEIRKAGER